MAHSPPPEDGEMMAWLLWSRGKSRWQRCRTKPPLPLLPEWIVHFNVEVLAAMVYVPDMSQTLEKRVEELEHKLAELTNSVSARKPRKKDWQKTFGLSRGDEGFKEMVELGREYRQSLREKGNGAGS